MAAVIQNSTHAETGSLPVLLLGCDFSSRPTRRKPVVVAIGQLSRGCLRLLRLERFETLEAWQQFLALPPEAIGASRWVGGFDVPFGLPRELVEHLGWPTDWRECMAFYAQLERSQIRDLFVAFCDARPVGGKFAHRATDVPAGSSPSMKWVNPPVAYMLHAGVPALLQAGVHLPGLHQGDKKRVALEAYPGLLARQVLGRRSYKNDDKAKQTTERWIARKDLLTALEQGLPQWACRVQLSQAQRETLLDDASGDSLDAVLCMVQAAWAQQQYAAGDALYGLPHDLDPLEGWIVGA